SRARGRPYSPTKRVSASPNFLSRYRIGRAMSRPAWVSCHIHYSVSLDNVLLNGVTPLLAVLRRLKLADYWFFLRYWDGGPHLRLRLLPRHDADRTLIEEVTTRSLERFLTANPARQCVSPQEYQAAARQFARWEGVETFEPVLRPDNSIYFAPYRPEYDRFGSEAT